MPLSLDPNAVIRLQISSDVRRQGAGKAPTFNFKPTTNNMFLELHAVQANMTEENSIQVVAQVLQKMLISMESDGKTSMPDVMNILTPAESLNLLAQYTSACSLGPDDKKKLSSPPSSEKAASAENAVPVNASIVRAGRSRTRSNVASAAAAAAGSAAT